MLASLAPHTGAGGNWTCVRRGLPITAPPPGRRGRRIPGARPFRCDPFPALSLKALWGEERRIRFHRRCKRQPSRKKKNQQNRLSSSTEGQQQHFPSS